VSAHPLRDVLLTGVPRSGTTLCCAELNRAPDVLALVEPMRVADFDPARGTLAACEQVASFLREARARVGESRPLPSAQVEGRIVDNLIGGAGTDGVLRRRRARRGEVQPDRALAPDFRLVVKHNALFTALLEPLSANFPVFAVVRDPLAVLASWNSVDLPVQQGHVPAGELFDTSLREALAAETDRIARQLLILDWFFARILRLVPPERIIRYEEVVTGRSVALAALGAPHAANAGDNRNRGYDAALLAGLAERLAARPGAWRQLYPSSAS